MYSYDYGYYDYGMEAEIMEFMDEFGYAILGVALGIMLIALAVMLVTYIFQSVGLYSIAKRRGIHNAWLAWIPVGNYWIAGSIADQYQYVAKGKVKNKRKVLLGLSLGSFAVSLVANMISSIMMIASDMEGAMAVSSMSGVFTSVLNMGVSVALFVFWQMALYDLYSSCNPDNNVLFLVLGIIFGITIPFFIFFNRKKDGGMPPRRSEPQAYIPQQPQYSEPEQPMYTEPQESWNNPEQL